MSLSVLPYILGAIGALSSADQSRKAGNQQRDANARAEAEAERRRVIQKRVQEMIDGSSQYAEAYGQRRAGQMQAGFQRDSAQLQNSTAGAFRIAGYKPGDTVTSDAVSRVSRERSMKWDQVVDSLIQQAKASRMQEAGAYAESAGITGPNQQFYSDQADAAGRRQSAAAQGVISSLGTIASAATAGKTPSETPPSDAPVAPPTIEQRQVQANIANGGMTQPGQMQLPNQINPDQLLPRKKRGMLGVQDKAYGLL